MITFVCWKWDAPRAVGQRARLLQGRPERQFTSEHVNALFEMIARWYRRPFQFVCITDDPEGLNPGIEAMRTPAAAIHDVPLENPCGPKFPNCYRRLWIFSRQAAALGERICQLDIDVVVTAELEPLLDRPEDFVGWCDEAEENKISGGIFLLKTGALPEVWEQFDPEKSPREHWEHGHQGSDQGWLSHRLYPPPGRWTRADGLTKLRWTPAGARMPPAGARMVFTTGLTPPWSSATRTMYPWIADYWK